MIIGGYIRIIGYPFRGYRYNTHINHDNHNNRIIVLISS